MVDVLKNRLKREKVEEHGNGEREMLPIYERLTNEERSLMAEREKLMVLEWDLKKKAEEKVVIVGKSIQGLKNEISELRHRCEELKEFISNSK